MTIDGPEEFRETADDILSRPEFAEEQPSLVQRAIDWTFEQLGDLFGGVVGSGGGYIVGYLILGGALALAAYLVWRFFPRKRLAPSHTGYEIERATTVRRSRAEWLAEAEEAEAAQEWDRAVRARYHALTAGLADDDQLAPEPSTTSGEHRARFAANATAGTMAGAANATADRVEVFDRAVDRYEEVWFGGEVAARPDDQALQAADRRLLEGDR